MSADKKMPFNAGDEEQVAERSQGAKAREVRRVAGLMKILADPDMRTWMWELLATCGIYRTSFTGNSETFFREGSRNVGLKVQADIMKHAPDALLKMMKESENG